MKLQYLGDRRDAFKWDVLLWLCIHSEESFKGLVFIPMLTPADSSGDGSSNPKTFPARNPQIQGFLEMLRRAPCCLSYIIQLGQLEIVRPFPVTIHPEGEDPNTEIGRGKDRVKYWQRFTPEKHNNSIIFLDPDNGFQTKTQDGIKWVRFDEIEQLLDRLTDDSAVLVYQHRPRALTWEKALTDLPQRWLSFAGHAPSADCLLAVYTGQVALVALTKTRPAGARMRKLLRGYIEENAEKPAAEWTITRPSKSRLRIWPE